MIFKVNHKTISHCSQRSVCSIKECVRTNVVTRLKPFPFEHSPKHLSDVQMWRIWWQEEKVQTSFFPQRTQGEQLFRPVNGGVVKHYDRLALDGEREAVKKVNHPVGIYAFVCSKPMCPAMPIHHGEAVEPCAALRRYIDILFGKFPAVGHIRLLTNMGFISIVEVYLTFMPQLFKLLQLPKFVLVELRRGFPLRAFPYTSKSCANALKKRLSVSSQAVFPVAASHCALAATTLERSFSMACRIISSSCVPMIGLRPRPGRVSSPVMPSDSNRFTQLLTDTWFISSCSPTLGELMPCAFKSTALHRIRKACDEPLRYPFSSEDFCAGVNSNFLILPI